MKNPISHKVMITLFTALLFLAVQTNIYAQVPEKAMLEYPEADKNMNTVKKAMEAYETGNWELLRNSVTEDVRFYNLGSFDSLNLDQTIEYWKKGRETATPTLAENQIWLPVSVKEGPRQGQWVLHWGSNTLSYPNGESISFPYHIATRMEGDKISRIYFYYDNNRIIRAMGYAIDPPLKEEDDEGLEDFKPNEKRN
ncbi:hypothetical protein SAMN04488034_10569 [Salinimicrobium catena]|uniref:Nuclear transport factor 2 family protein n=1 Tax=Salinimicrobium catena TaxID=390640 RepID=A0A1H5NQ38_9FLAO|nr:hypothetical protein [Salinimicrobium catena]SDL55038.1 hypothetical protein SAMN04488140_10592 [Salinimicrobium catena]SEF03686.1 hypothetical protein SAMN04488034_10569 [Salinimicrobium catena]